MQAAVFDLIIVGAGAAGLTAALVASQQGLSVLLCEASALIGGTAATSAGTLWIPGNTISRDAGYTDTPEEASTYLDSLIGQGFRRDMRQAYLSTAAEAIDHISALGINFVPCGTHPDYRPWLPGAKTSGRAIIPAPFDGRLLGREFGRVRPPIDEFMVLGGMMLNKADISHLLKRYKSFGSLVYSAKLVSRYLRDRLRHKRGTRLVMGNSLVAQLYHALLRHHVEISFNTRLRELTVDDGRVTGAVFRRGGADWAASARIGVVLATGGLGHNKELRQRLFDVPMEPLSMSSTENLGEGVASALKAGARISPDEHMSGGLWTPVSRVPRVDGTVGLYPHFVLDRAKPGLIAVDSRGMRFTNEAVSYHDFVLAMFARPEPDRHRSCHFVCDANFIKKYGLGAIHPGTTQLEGHSRSGYIKTADTLAELAALIGVDTGNLERAVGQNNNDARHGVDTAFGRGESALEQFNGDPHNEPNPCIGPIETAPFCAMEIWPADIAVSVGLDTNGDAQVLDNDGNVIEGLYACGNDMASVMQGTYPGPGTTLGPAVTFAYRAARHAAGRSAVVAHGAKSAAGDVL